MASILDQGLHVGLESTYGTAVTPTRSFEAQADGHKRQQAFLESLGMRSGMQTLRSDRRLAINMGAEGTITLDVLSKGMGMLFKAMMGASTNAQQGVTAAYLQEHDTNAEGPTDSLTVNVNRVDVGGTARPFNYEGGKVASWKFSHSVGGLLTLELTMDYENEDGAAAAATPTYPSSTRPYPWTELAVTVNGSAFEPSSIEVSGDNNLNVDRRFMRSSALKKEPIRQGQPTYSGQLVGEFTDLTTYNLFTAGTIVPIVLTWTGPTAIESPHFPYVKLTMPACQFDGDTPEIALDGNPTQTLPFRVLHDGTNPAVSLDYMTADTSY